jgi:hypothetical protein
MRVIRRRLPNWLVGLPYALFVGSSLWQRDRPIVIATIENTTAANSNGNVTIAYTENALTFHQVTTRTARLINVLLTNFFRFTDSSMALPPRFAASANSS